LRHQRNSLPRPLLALLLAHSKMSLFDALLRSEVPDDPTTQRFLDSYFPKTLRDRFAQHFKSHTLRREIVATAVVNYCINNGGIRLIGRLGAAGAPAAEAVLAYLEADGQLRGPDSREKILQAGVPAAEEHQLLLQLEDMIEAAARDLLQGAGKVETPIGS
jgi:glutamate dehydrogenase